MPSNLFLILHQHLELTLKFVVLHVNETFLGVIFQVACLIAAQELEGARLTLSRR